MEYQSTFERTTSKALEATGVPSDYLSAPARPDLLNGAYLYGRTGRGKTYAACGAIRAFVEAHVREIDGEWVYYGPRARFVNVPAWFFDMKATYDQRGESEKAIFDRYAHAKLLVLDDLGKGSRTDWAVDRLYMLLDYRASRYDRDGLRTIITSNYGLAKVASMLAGDEGTIEPLVSRAYRTCSQTGIEVDGDDMRRKKS